MTMATKLRVASALLLAGTAAFGCSAPAQGAPAPAPWKRVVLVELFTSQGCSSCPPADAFVRELPGLGVGRDKVIPLTFHVDYWDRLGWKDPFANPKFTARQEQYARAGKLRSPDGPSGLDGLYTPQMIVDGKIHFSGQRREIALREMERAGARPPALALVAEADVRGATVEVAARVSPPGDAKRDQDWRLVAALVAKKARTAVAHGENGGETLDEVSVVRVLSERIPIPGGPGAPLMVRLGKPADLAWSAVEVVVFVQSEATGEIGAVQALDARRLAVR
jgi:hypothetical protein